jgi:hypothetical protein
MNKKVFISMLVLSIVFLVGMYVLKIFFPQEFVLTIENERIIAIGQFIDSHTILRHVCGGITAFIVMWLYCCICCRKKRLGIKYTSYIVISIVILRLLLVYNSNLFTIFNTCMFFILPAIMKGDLKLVAISFSLHSSAQYLSMSIRNLPLYFANSLNFVTTLIMSIDCYLWLAILYIIVNIKTRSES